MHDGHRQPQHARGLCTSGAFHSKSMEAVRLNGPPEYHAAMACLDFEPAELAQQTQLMRRPQKIGCAALSLIRAIRAITIPGSPNPVEAMRELAFTPIAVPL